jgi:hypothetical protein
MIFATLIELLLVLVTVVLVAHYVRNPRDRDAWNDHA